jgi:hypothetical protein
MRVSCGLLLVVLWAGLLAGGEPAPQAADIVLADVRWQALPRTVQRVYAAPDGRVWFCCERMPSRSSNVAMLKQEIEREFQRAAPQVADVEPVLFEPGGRVWFSFVQAGHLLLAGYDGREWTDYAMADRNDRITGRCPTRGGLLEGRANRCAGGRAWFITCRGVLQFDGRQWTYEKLIQSPLESGAGGWVKEFADDGVWLAVSPDGKAAVAYVAAAQSFWVFHEGKWGRCEAIVDREPIVAEADGPFAVPAQVRPRRAAIAGLALPDGRAAWYLSPRGALRCLAILPDEKTSPPGFQNLIDELKDDSYQTRIKASRRLEEMGPAIKAHLQKALDDSADPEQQMRLQSLLRKLAAPEDPERVETVFASVRVSRCRQLYEDGAGRVFVVADKLDRRQAGVLIMGRDGKPAAMLGERFAAGWQRTRGEAPPILTASGDQVWLAFPGTAQPPRLLDLKKPDFVDSLPDPAFFGLHAVSAEGRVFVSAGAPQSSRHRMSVYTPGAPTADHPPPSG